MHRKTVATSAENPDEKSKSLRTSLGTTKRPRQYSLRTTPLKKNIEKPIPTGRPVSSNPPNPDDTRKDVVAKRQDRRVDACVLDSPFADFARVVGDYCNETWFFWRTWGGFVKGNPFFFLFEIGKTMVKPIKTLIL